MNLTQFVDVFDESDFELQSDGFHRIKHPNLVYQKLREICTTNGLTYNWTLSGISVHPVSGKTTVYGDLKVFVSGDPYVNVAVPGVATGYSADTEPAGVTTTAFINACLRGLGMAESIYAKERAPAPPQPAQQYAPPQQPAPQYQQQPPQYQGNNQPRQPARNNYQNQNRQAPRGGGGNRGGGNFRPKVGGNGKYAGMFYDELPIEVLQQWASFADPNKRAVEELEKRMGAGTVPNTQYGNTQPDYDENEVPF